MCYSHNIPEPVIDYQHPALMLSALTVLDRHYYSSVLIQYEYARVTRNVFIRRIEEWRYNSTHSQFRYKIEISDRLHGPATHCDRRINRYQSWSGRQGKVKKYIPVPTVKPRLCSQ